MELAVVPSIPLILGYEHLGALVPRYPSNADWPLMRPLIQVLYRDENRTLKDVMVIMEREHGFKATIKQYKNRISEWKLDKRNKKDDVLALVRKKVQRDAAGRKSSFRLRSRAVNPEDAFRYLKRKGISIQEAIEQSPGTPIDLIVFTPPASPRLITSPDSFRSAEWIITNARNFVIGSIDARTLITNEPNSFCTSVKAHNDETVTMDKVFQNLTHACHLIESGSLRSGGYLLVKATHGFRDLIRDEQPRMLTQLLETTVRIRRKGYVDISNSILKQFRDMSAVVLASGHPLIAVFASLSKAGFEDTETIILQIWQLVLMMFEECLGRHSVSAHFARIRYIRSVEATSNPKNAEAMFRDLAAQCKELFGSHDIRYWQTIYRLAWHHMVQGKYDQAVLVAQSLLDIANSSELSSEAQNYVRCDGFYILAIGQFELGDQQLAEAAMRKALALSNINVSLGPDHPETLTKWTTLSDWLHKWGRHVEASEIEDFVLHLAEKSTPIL